MDDKQFEQIEAAIEKGLRAAMTERHPCFWNQEQRDLINDILMVASIFKRGIVWTVAILLLLGTAMLMRDLIIDVSGQGPTQELSIKKGFIK